MEFLSPLKTIYASKRPTATPTKRPWRTACLGLNTEGDCRNSHCPAFASRVRCHQGFGVFNVGDAVPCPICRTPTPATRMGLIGCQWMIEQGDNTPMWGESNFEEYQRFGLNLQGLEQQQHRLVVTAMALPSMQGDDMELDGAETCAESFETLNLTTCELRDSIDGSLSKATSTRKLKFCADEAVRFDRWKLKLG